MPHIINFYQKHRNFRFWDSDQIFKNSRKMKVYLELKKGDTVDTIKELILFEFQGIIETEHEDIANMILGELHFEHNVK